MRTATAKRPRATSDDYLKLVRKFPLRPIANDAELQAAHHVLRPLFLREETDLAPGEIDYLGALALLVERYEQTRFSIPKHVSTPHERLLHLVVSAGMTPADVMELLDISQPQVSLILNGKRALSKANIKCLAAHFKLDAAYFL